MVDLRDDDTIWWEGWETSWKKLRASGWYISIKPKYQNWRQPFCSAASHEKIYIRHRESKQMGRIVLTDDNAQSRKVGAYELDFLTQECNHRTKPPTILNERDLTLGDVPLLLEIILSLQESVKPKKKPSDRVKEQAEILLLKQVNGGKIG